MTNVIKRLTLGLSKLDGRTWKQSLTVLMCAAAIVLQSPHTHADIVDIAPTEKEARPSPDSLQSRVPGDGILFCSGKKGQDILECNNGRLSGIRSDLYRIASSGWSLRQVLSDEKNGVWYFFFQR